MFTKIFRLKQPEQTVQQRRHWWVVGAQDILQLAKIGRPKARHGVPTSCRLHHPRDEILYKHVITPNRKKKRRATHVEAWRATTRITPLGHVIQAALTYRVEHGVEEAEWWLARSDGCIIQERNDASKGWRGSGSATD